MSEAKCECCGRTAERRYFGGWPEDAPEDQKDIAGAPLCMPCIAEAINGVGDVPGRIRANRAAKEPETDGALRWRVLQEMRARGIKKDCFHYGTVVHASGQGLDAWAAKFGIKRDAPPAQAMGVPTCPGCGKAVPADGICTCGIKMEGPFKNVQHSGGEWAPLPGAPTLKDFAAAVDRWLLPMLPKRLTVVTDAGAGGLRFALWVYDGKHEVIAEPFREVPDEQMLRGFAYAVAAELMKREARGPREVTARE